MRNLDDTFADAQTVFAFLSETEEEPDTADIVLAMGSQDFRVADTAVRAFRETHADWLVCSGGFGKDTAALFHKPEGLLYAERCQKLGVPKERILTEDRASNSGENFSFSKQLLAQRGIVPATGVVACKPYMAKRAWAVGTKQWPEVRWYIFRQSLRFTEYLDQGNDLTTVLELMTGDLQRLRVYAGTFQTPIPVPEPVWAAYERLAADGYDRYVIRES